MHKFLRRTYFFNDYPKFLELILGYIDCYEVFQDIPFSFPGFLQDLVRNFPNEKFIYTQRDPYDWYMSLLNHHAHSAGFTYTIENNRVYLENTVIDKLSKWNYRGSDQVQMHKLLYNLQDESQIYDQNIYMKYQQDHELNARKLLSNVESLFIDIKNQDSYLHISNFLNIPKNDIIKLPQSNKRR